MNYAVDTPLLLLLAPLALAPFFFSSLRALPMASVDAAPADDFVSRLFTMALSALGAIAVLGALLGAAGLHMKGGRISRAAEGAEIVVLIDRSGSMNETFAGRRPSGEEESKAAASRRILSNFFSRRRHDLVGVAAFSTSPLLVLPPTDHAAAVQAALAATDRPGLDYTNIARGLGLALSMFKPGDGDRSRAILLVSDGAARIDPKVQDQLRADFRKVRVNLYWLYLRTQGSKGIYDPVGGEDDTPQALPERHLDLFFKSLDTPYRAFEAEGPRAVEEAVAQIDRLERSPIEVVEELPRRDLAPLAISAALIAALLLLCATLAEALTRRFARAPATGVAPLRKGGAT